MKKSTKRNLGAVVLYALAFGGSALGFWLDGDLTKACIGLGLFGYLNTVMNEVLNNSMIYEEK